MDLLSKHVIPRSAVVGSLLEDVIPGLCVAGAVVGSLLEDVIPVMVANLNPEKEPEVRLKFFTLLSRLLLNAPQTVDSQHKYDSLKHTQDAMKILA